MTIPPAVGTATAAGGFSSGSGREVSHPMIDQASDDPFGGLELSLDAPDDIDFGDPGPLAPEAPSPEPPAPERLEIDLDDCPF